MYVCLSFHLFIFVVLVLVCYRIVLLLTLRDTVGRLRSAVVLYGCCSSEWTDQHQERCVLLGSCDWGCVCVCLVRCCTRFSPAFWTVMRSLTAGSCRCRRRSDACWTSAVRVCVCSERSTCIRTSARSSSPTSSSSSTLCSSTCWWREVSEFRCSGVSSRPLISSDRCSRVKGPKERFTAGPVESRSGPIWICWWTGLTELDSRIWLTLTCSSCPRPLICWPHRRKTFCRSCFCSLRPVSSKWFYYIHTEKFIYFTDSTRLHQ